MAEGGRVDIENKIVSRTLIVTITQILGGVRSTSDVTMKGRPADNSTRWVFDIETSSLETEGEHVVELFLLDPRNEKIVFRPDIFSCAFAPLGDGFYAARPYIEHRESDGAFLFHACRVSEAVRYRVGLDTIHSATR